MKILCEGPDESLVMRNSGEGRQPGVHLSDITKRMLYEQDKRFNPNSPIDAMVLERGFTWEEVLSRSLSGRHHRGGSRPEQIQEDGIWLSPDWITDEPVLEEWKATKKSSRNGFQGVSSSWLMNVGAYLRACLKRKIVQRPLVRFWIWWINGDYTFESKSSDFHLFNEYWKVECQFSQRELDEGWTRILTAGQRYGLLKKEPQWDLRTERENQNPKPSPQPRERKNAGPQRSNRSTVITFRPGKRRVNSNIA